MQHIKKIGIELEGYWHEKPPRAKEDGSVNATCREDCPGYSSFRRSGWRGELASLPILPTRWENFMKTKYPDHTDGSCGLHVHMSFNNPADYTRLMFPDFWEFFLESWQQWATINLNDNCRFWPRFRGENNFCLRQFSPQSQWADRSHGGSRYTHLNYCWNQHAKQSELNGRRIYENGTLECRLLPMFVKKETAISAIWHLLSIVNTFLDTCDRSPVELGDNPVPTDESIKEEQIHEVVTVRLNPTHSEGVMDYPSHEKMEYNTVFNFDEPLVQEHNDHVDILVNQVVGFFERSLGMA
jgi:hypothetical protein